MGYKETLLSPIKIGRRECPNRFFIQAMECNDEDETGNPSESTTERYEELFRGEAGLVSLEAISVTRESRSRDNQLMIMAPNREPLTKFVQRVKAANPKSLFIFQLTHSGELSNPAFSRRVTVKPLPGYGGELLTEEEVDKIMDGFVLAAEIAHDAGADGIDMKLCHGYFGSQILRPYNDRKWKYGGSWENRSRFAFELYERIAKAVNDPNFLIGSKISAWEGFPGGFGTAGVDSPVIDLTEPIALLKGLEERGAQFFIQSAGSPSITISLTQVDKHVPYFAYLHQTFSKAFKDHLKPETVVIGSNYSVFRNGKNGLCAVNQEESSLLHFGAKCIEDGVTDMIGLGRQSFADPYLPKKLREGKEAEIKYCTVCDNCLELLIQQSKVGCCTFNKRYTDILVQTRKEKGKLTVAHT
ncbi:2,4-dienoyl-CoA reductase-like NADH-dependent reductase (Old Yellow Enzyme family) [Hydrogenispora ethanolica]|uniref:2,4-dienoyl-CoA reductase-like NADH-dependent reductase (Old Yellow Enzyme family) n=1 Tax=Hydrogenispora ethanolica TaxID=1082276 RepID=A0A4R1SBY6_HYDET|nr:2,4-dienoyl-CoA reductase [Hydrogenispora ethanolica]TCL77018.1 2,4-dienoyl-CoA reductase-like NADH-dependent reductase (Old Yellow Enzyme family) [Hydrogenispora ethanolica]